MAAQSNDFTQWSVDEVKTWVNSWKFRHEVSQSTINNIIPVIDLYKIDGSTLLYVTQHDFKNEFGLSETDSTIVGQRIDYLHKHPYQNNKSQKEKPKDTNQQNDDNKQQKQDKMNDDNVSSTTFTEGYLSTKGQEVYICLQKGTQYTKMPIDSSCTVSQLKQKFLAKTTQKGQNDGTNPDDIVLLFMGSPLNDKKTLNECKIGCNNVTTIFVAERIRSKQSQMAGEAAGILFINKHDNSEHILYVDTTMSFGELKGIYKNYLIKQYQDKQMRKEAQKLYEQSVLFECSGKKFRDKSLLKDCGIGLESLQYIFVSFGSITEEEKETDDHYISKIYQMTPKEHQQVSLIKETFEKSIKTDQFQKSVQEISKTFKAVSVHELDQMKSYPHIQDMVKEQTSDQNKQATAYTKKILNTPPTGKLGQDVNTTLHVISNIFKSAGDECVFYDSRQGVKLNAGDSGCAIHEAFQRDKPFVLRLQTLEGLYGVSKDDMKDDTRKLIEMQSSIHNDVEHPTLAHVKGKLSAALGVQKERIHIIDVFAGSDCFKYTVENLTWPEKQRMIQGDPTGRLGQQFRTFKDLKIHPLLFRPAFDVANFDQRGNKSFVSSNGKFQVGPANMKKEYTQPTGWTRYGLKVLAKYGDDKWLHPFKDPGNWWRAFHGTKRAAVYQRDPADAMADIHNNGFLPAQRAAYGPGVYCSPKPPTAEGYAAEVTMPIQEGNVNQNKKFKFMLQVAVKPGANTLTVASNDNVWSVQNKDDIRAYGILIKEVP
eukprot:115885_1